MFIILRPYIHICASINVKFSSQERNAIKLDLELKLWANTFTSLDRDRGWDHVSCFQDQDHEFERRSRERSRLL